jgi:hypothetical protein
MQIINIGIVKSAILTAALGIVSTCASAATLKVNLPVEARWGSAVLPPGDYTVDYSEGTTMMKVSGGGKTVTVLVVSRNPTKPDTTTSEFRLVDVDGTPTIKEFQSAVSGQIYYFKTKKPSQVVLAKSDKHDESRTQTGLR